MSLEQTLCFKYPRKVARDNTLKYNWRTLQLLPDGIRPSYAGLQVEVQEDLEGRLLVQYLGQTIPTHEAPPRPGLLRATNAAPPDDPRRSQCASGARCRWQDSLAPLETGERPTGPSGLASPRRKSTEGPRLDRGPYGKRCNRPSFEASPFGQSPGSWASPGTPRRSTPSLKAPL